MYLNNDSFKAQTHRLPTIARYGLSIVFCFWLSACAVNKTEELVLVDPEQQQRAAQAQQDEQLFAQALKLSSSAESSEQALISAREMFEQLYQANPDYLGALANAADMEFRLKRFDEAQEKYLLLLDRATQAKAEIKTEQQQPAQPEISVTNAADEVSTDPKKFNKYTVYSLNQLGLLARERGEFDQAEQYYRRALALEPNQPEVLRNLAIFLDLYRGKLDDALKLYQRYQSLLEIEDSQVKDWIFDLKNRLPEDAVNE